MPVLSVAIAFELLDKLEHLSVRPLAHEFIAEEGGEIPNAGKLERVIGASCGAILTGKDMKERKTRILLSEIGAWDIREKRE